jgi:peptidoglycan/LPS O-acetylase OafA/YrhL
MNEPRHFAYLDAVRGFAFLSVILLHAGLCVGPFPGSAFLLEGGYGVQLFFLASAITLCQSMSARNKVDRFPVGFFYLRRLFRIAPLFWTAMACYWIFPSVMPAFWQAQWAPLGVRPSYFFLTAIFLHGWHPYTFNSIVPGGWSIAVEMTFYIFFPLVFYFVNSLKRAVIAVLLGLFYLKFMVHTGPSFDSVIPYLRRHFLAGVPENISGFFLGLWFPMQLPVFLVGFLTYYFLGNALIKRAVRSKFWAWSLLISCGVALLNCFMSEGGFVPTLFCVALVLAGVIIAFSGGAIPLLVNPVICFVGRISYSCYLVHFAALGITLKLLGVHLTEASPSFDAGGAWPNCLFFFKLLVASVLLTIMVATLTFHFIEKPGIALGRKIIQKIIAHSSQSSSSAAAMTLS